MKTISTLIGYLLTDGLNDLTVKYLAGWHLEKRAAVLKLVSFPVYLGCYPLHYGVMYASVFKLCASLLRICVMQNKKLL